jgi:hypothetical protein
MLPTQTASYNRYVYAWSDPINLIDADGRLPARIVFDSGPGGAEDAPRGYVPNAAFFLQSWLRDYPPPPDQPGFDPRDYYASRAQKRRCETAPDGRTISLNGALGVLGGASLSAEVVFDYDSGEVTLVVSGGFGASGAVAQVGVSTGFIFGQGNSVPSYTSGGNTTVSASLPSGLGISITSSSGGLTGNPTALSALSATAIQVGYSAGLVSLLGGFGATAQNTISKISLGNFTTGLAAVLANPADSALYTLQRSCE